MQVNSQYTVGVVTNTPIVEPNSDQVTALLEPIQLQGFERAPRPFYEEWKETQEANRNSTAKIFLENGFPAWFTYSLAKRVVKNQSHFNGKAKLCQLISDLETKPIAYRKTLAAQVAAAIPPERRDKINRLKGKTTSLQMSPRSNKRRRRCFVRSTSLLV